MCADFFLLFSPSLSPFLTHKVSFVLSFFFCPILNSEQEKKDSSFLSKTTLEEGGVSVNRSAIIDLMAMK